MFSIILFWNPIKILKKHIYPTHNPQFFFLYTNNIFFYPHFIHKLWIKIMIARIKTPIRRSCLHDKAFDLLHLPGSKHQYAIHACIIRHLSLSSTKGKYPLPPSSHHPILNFFIPHTIVYKFVDYYFLKKLKLYHPQYPHFYCIDNYFFLL